MTAPVVNINTKTVADPNGFADRVRAALRKSAEGFIEAGRVLIEAKAALPHGEWLPFVESLPIGENTVKRLIVIASDERLLNRAHAPDLLPSSRETLYELTKLDDDSWALAEERGLIRPDLERKEITAFRESLRTPGAPAPTTEPEVLAKPRGQGRVMAKRLDGIVMKIESIATVLGADDFDVSAITGTDAGIDAADRIMAATAALRRLARRLRGGA